MSIGAIWLVYIIVFIVAFLILLLPFWTLDFGVAVNLFIASLIALIVAAIMMATVDFNALTQDEKNWAAFLGFVSVVIPLVLALWVVFASCYSKWEEPEAKVLLACDNDTGHCDPVAAKVKTGNLKVKAYFKGGESPLRTQAVGGSEVPQF